MVKTFKVEHIATGDLLRVHLNATELADMKAGKLVSDEVVGRVVLPKLKEYRSWLLDGYPRTLLQAKLLTSHKVDMVINLNVPDETIMERLEGRWIHAPSGRIYHMKYNPPKVEGIDDVTGEPLKQREDDHPDIIKQRLHIYHSQIKPIIQYYDEMSLLKCYSGTESDVIWPKLKTDVENFLLGSG